MMRVARRAALVFEARDSFLLNIAKHLGYTMDYEIESVSGSLEMKSGGAANSGIPNFHLPMDGERSSQDRPYSGAEVRAVSYVLL